MILIQLIKAIYHNNPKSIPLAQTPGPDLACKDAVMESRAFMSSKTVAYPHAVAPGQAGMPKCGNGKLGIHKQ